MDTERLIQTVFVVHEPIISVSEWRLSFDELTVQIMDLGVHISCFMWEFC